MILYSKWYFSIDVNFDISSLWTLVCYWSHKYIIANLSNILAPVGKLYQRVNPQFFSDKKAENV